jgi:hypothetical protein
MKTHRLLGSCLGLVLAASLAGCADDEVGEGEEFETWNAANNPAYVDANFVYDVKKLPASGETERPPIPGDYWATYRDNLNHRWDGEDSLSPSEKWAKAFNRPKTPEAISRNHGIMSGAGWRKACTTSSDCSDLKDGSTCALPRGQSKGFCIPTWWGICHGWAPYALSEPAAIKPVTKNGVTFYPGDLEGLMSLAYAEGLRVKFLSQRCDADNPMPAEDGRIPASECRDMNPGSLHVLLSNLVGIRKQGFVEDRTYDDEVWNQPIRAFRVTNAVGGKLKQVKKAEAIKLVGGTGSSYKWNTKAKKFYYVELELDYITESSPGRESHVGQVDNYTRTDHYQYVLETDSKSRIIGGEWVGSSRTSHPDFAWWPTEAPQGEIADGLITYEEVKALNDQAAQ